MADERRTKKHSFHSVAFKSVFMLLPSPSVVDESLITLADGNRNASFYVHDSTQTNVGGGGWSATETKPKIIQIDFRQKIINYFYFGRKAINTQMEIALKIIIEIMSFGA